MYYSVMVTISHSTKADFLSTVPDGLLERVFWESSIVQYIGAYSGSMGGSQSFVDLLGL